MNQSRDMLFAAPDLWRGELAKQKEDIMLNTTLTYHLVVCVAPALVNYTYMAQANSEGWMSPNYIGYLLNSCVSNHLAVHGDAPLYKHGKSQGWELE